jgi:glycosyltransferase involved in cell wall biosynthesis
MAPTVAVVHDWLDTWRGGENVLAEVLALYPQANLFALVDFLPERLRARLAGRRATTSFLQRLPGARRHFRNLLPLMPSAVERLDIRGHDIVISISHAVAKGVCVAPGQLHVCLCLTPIRYAWDLREQYLEVTGIGRGLRGVLARALLERIRRWDARTSERVHRFVAISEYVRERIERCYGREATVVYPPVDVDFYAAVAGNLADGGTRRSADTYVAGSRFVPYKRLDLIAAAFRTLPDRRLLLFGDGPEAARIRAAAGDNVRFVGEPTREGLRDLLAGSRAFVFAAEEDFGILPVEAQASGTPVIAYGRGGACETVRALGTSDAPTGVLYDEQTPQAIAAAIRRFESAADAFVPKAAIEHARAFSAERFRQRFAEVVAEAWRTFPADSAVERRWPAAS